MINATKRQALKLLAGSSLPPSWFYTAPPVESELAARTGKLHIEIISHCWQYSRLLAYQLSSLIEHPINNAQVTMTVYYSPEDAATSKLLEFFSDKSVCNVHWNWRELPPPMLFRRAIGRNLGALQSTADWVWFTDCDLTFQHNCIDSLNKALQARQDVLVYPRVESKTDVYTDDDLITSNELTAAEILHVDSAKFRAYPVSRATGPLQITHGDVARSMGYCQDVAFYQAPSSHWEKATEDRMFRWLLGSQGVGIDVDGVCRIQHAVKGRYREDSPMSKLRQRVRQWQHMLRK